MRRRFYDDATEGADRLTDLPGLLAPPADTAASPSLWPSPEAEQSAPPAANASPAAPPAAPAPADAPVADPAITTDVFPEDDIIDTSPAPWPELYVPSLAEIGPTAIGLILAGAPPPYAWVALPADAPALDGIFDDAPDGLVQVLAAWRAAPALVAGLAPINPDTVL